MPKLTYDFEVGVDGNNVVAGVGMPTDTWTLVQTVTNVTNKFAAAGASHGSMGYACVTTASSISGYLQKDLTAADEYAVSFYFKIPTLLSATLSLFSFRNIAGSIHTAHIQVTSANKLQLYNSAGSPIAASLTTLAISANTIYRVEAVVNSVTGAWKFALYLGDSGTATSGGADSFTGTGAAFGTVQTDRCRLGRAQANTSGATTVYYDSVQIENRSTFIGGWTVGATTVRPNAVTANAGVYTNVGGAASLEAALADESDTTYAQSPANPSAATITLAHPQLATGNVTINIRHAVDTGSPPINVTYDLLQGASTVISTRTYNAVSSTITAVSWTTSAGETANITDRTDLRLRASATV